MVWLFFVLLVLSWCLWFCCAVSQPPQCKYNPLRCPFRLKDGSHYSVSMSAAHHTVTLTHTHNCWPHTQTKYAHTRSNKHVHRPKNAHTHTHTVLQQLAAVSCMPSSSSLFLSFLHTLQALHGYALSDTDKCYLRHLRCSKKHSRTWLFSIFTPPSLCCWFFSSLSSIHAYENQARWVNGNSFLSFF